MPYLFIRIKETFMAEIFPSIILAWLISNEVFVSAPLIIVIIMLACIYFNILYLKKCLFEYYTSVENKAIYYRVNLTVFLLFTTANIIFAALNTEPYYTYFFLQYKLLNLAGINKILSALAIRLIQLYYIITIPFRVILSD